MKTLGFSQFVSGPTHQAGHTLDLIFGADLVMDPITINKVPWSDHFTLKTHLLIPHTSSADKICFYARPKKLMEPGSFLNALQDPIPQGASIDELVNDWQLRLTSAIDTVAPLRLFRPRPKRAPWYTEELRGKKRELRHLERTWRKTRNEATRTSYRTLMRSYEIAIKTAKREYFAASIASASSHPAQLFKII